MTIEIRVDISQCIHNMARIHDTSICEVLRYCIIPRAKVATGCTPKSDDRSPILILSLPNRLFTLSSQRGARNSSDTVCTDEAAIGSSSA